MRYPITFFLSLIITIILILLSLPLFIDANPYRQKIAAQIEAAIGAPSVIGGQFGIRFVPEFGFIANDVEIVRATPFTIDQIFIELSLWQFLRSNAIIRRLEIDGATISLAADTDISDLQIPNIEEIIWQNVHIHLQTPQGAFDFSDIEGGFSGDLQAQKIDVQGLYRGQEFSANLHRHAQDIKIDFTNNQQRLGFDGKFKQAPEWELSGEFQYQDKALIPNLLAQWNMQAAQSTISSFEGLIFMSPQGWRTEDMEITLFNQTVRANMSLPHIERAFEEAASQALTLEIIANQFNLDLINISPQQVLDQDAAVARKETVPDILMAYIGNPNINFSLQVDRLIYNQQTIQNFDSRAIWDAPRLRLNYFSAYFPFDSHILLRGDIMRAQSGSVFSGFINGRSSQFISLSNWLAAPTAYASDWQAYTKDIEWTKNNFSGAVKWQSGILELTNFTGQIDEQAYAFDTYLDFTHNHINGRLMAQISRMNAQKWGMRQQEHIRSLADLPYQTWIETLLGSKDEAREFALQLQIDELNFERLQIENIALHTSAKDYRLDIKELRIGHYQDQNIELAGALKVKDEHIGGQVNIIWGAENAYNLLSPLARHLFPVEFNFDQNFQAQGRWTIPLPDDANWPENKFIGSAKLGKLSAQYTLTAQGYDFAPHVVGTAIQLTLAAPSEDMSHFLNWQHLPQNQQARLDIQSRRQTQDLSQINLSLQIGEDRFGFSGRAKPVTDGAQLQGQGTFKIAHIDDYILPDHDYLNRLASYGQGQMTFQNNQFSFSNLQMQLAQGTVSGEGVITYGDIRPQLSAFLRLQNMNLTPALPVFSDGWSQDNMTWPLFARGDANIELTGEALQFADLPPLAIQAKLRLIDGVLEAKNVELRAGEGLVYLDILTEGGSLVPSVRIDGRMNNLPLSIFPFAAPVPLYGDLSGAISFAGRGRSVAEMMTSFLGEGQIEIRDGKIYHPPFNERPPYLEAFSRAIALLDIKDNMVSINNVTFLRTQSAENIDLDDKPADDILADMIFDFTDLSLQIMTQYDKDRVHSLVGTISDPKTEWLPLP